MENEDITPDLNITGALIKLVQEYKSDISYNTDNHRKMDSAICITNIALINLLIDLSYIAEFPGITGLEALTEYRERSFTERHLIYKLMEDASVEGFLNTLINQYTEDRKTVERILASAIETD